MPDIWGIAAILAKLALYVGVMGATGLLIVLVAYSKLVAPVRARMRWHTAALAMLALLAAGFGFMLRGAALTGGIDGMTDPDMLALLWSTPVGDVLVYRIAGLSLMLCGLFIPNIGPWIALVGGALALWSFAQIGHIPETGQLGVRVLLLLHLLGVSFWVGVLGPLRKLSREADLIEIAAQLGHRFGQAATLVVPALILAGGIMAWQIVGDLSALFTTGYGLALVAKVALVALVLGLAAANKMRFVPAMQSGDVRASKHLAHSIEIETLVILAVLGATATLTSVLPLPN